MPPGTYKACGCKVSTSSSRPSLLPYFSIFSDAFYVGSSVQRTLNYSCFILVCARLCALLTVASFVQHSTYTHTHTHSHTHTLTHTHVLDFRFKAKLPMKFLKWDLRASPCPTSMPSLRSLWGYTQWRASARSGANSAVPEKKLRLKRNCRTVFSAKCNFCSACKEVGKRQNTVLSSLLA